jgi:general secretion pathway protein L
LSVLATLFEIQATLAQVFEWWWRQIVSLLPALLRRAGPPNAVIFAIERLEDDFGPPGGSILVRRAGQERFAAALRFEGPAPPNPAPGLTTALRLPAGLVLHRDITLPLAAERDLPSVLGFEMDRLTPFQPGEVLWSISNLRRDPVRGLTMTLLFTLRAPLEGLLESLAARNIKPAFVEAPAGRIALSPRTGGSNRKFQVSLLGLSALLALICLAILPIRHQVALNAAMAKIAALQPAASEALALGRQLNIAAASHSAIAAAQRSGDALQTIAALTTALPDGTYLTDLTLTSGDLTFDGFSTNAARLIAVLAGVPGFNNPRFVAPVTSANNGQTDLFSIRLTAAP